MKGTTDFVGGRVKDDSIWAVLHPECHVLFPDELFADLFTSTGPAQSRSCFESKAPAIVTSAAP